MPHNQAFLNRSVFYKELTKKIIKITQGLRHLLVQQKHIYKKYVVIVRGLGGICTVFAAPAPLAHPQKYTKIIWQHGLSF